MTMPQPIDLKGDKNLAPILPFNNPKPSQIVTDQQQMWATGLPLPMMPPVPDPKVFNNFAKMPNLNFNDQMKLS